MKTLDEVIEMLARGWVCDTVDVRRDALHYLKEYRKLDSLDAVAFTDDNPPLDWDELWKGSRCGWSGMTIKNGF